MVIKKIINTLIGQKNPKGPLDGGLLNDKEIGVYFLTIAQWLRIKETNLNSKKEAKSLLDPLKKNDGLKKFIKLYLNKEKKGGYIKDFAKADEKILYTMVIGHPIATIEKFMETNQYRLKELGLTSYKEWASSLEKLIGYKD